MAHQVANDKIYIISYRPWVYHPLSGKFSLMPTNNLKNTDALRLVYSNEHFSLLKRVNQIFYVPQENDSISLLCEIDPEETITALAYQDSTIWIGTDRGLGCYDMIHKKFHHIHTNYFEKISFLIGDKKGRLWICAHNKLFSYLIKEKKFTLWNSSDGFLPNDILAAHYTLSNPNFVYLGGAEGLVKINTNIPQSETQIPQISLADIKFNGCSYLKQMKNQTLHIPWNYNSLTIHICVKNEDIFQKNLLRYTISGRGKQTVESFDSELSLSSLSPGKYKIWVSSSTKDGEYTTPVPIINIVITPPWYKSSWFFSICTLLFILLSIKIALWVFHKKKKEMRDEMGDFVQTVLYNVLGNKEENTKEKDLEEITDTSYPQAMEATPLSSADADFIKKLDQIINENLSSEKLSIKYLTDTMAMSRASLYNKVKQITGLGVNEYINRLRIERSVYLLANTNLSISEISYEVGFSYPRYFSTSFKQMKGVTPSQFKEKNKNSGHI
ncbi:MAG: helix-turn-helix domain-containing protein [Phocaeicola vulgatus]